MALYSALSWGLVLMKFWYWFILPAFPMLPQINYWHAVGIFLFIGFFRLGDNQIIKDEYKQKETGVTMSLIAPWVTLLIGHMIHSWFM